MNSVEQILPIHKWVISIIFRLGKCCINLSKNAKTAFVDRIKKYGLQFFLIIGPAKLAYDISIWYTK